MTQHNYYPENFEPEEIILLILLLLNSMIYYNYERSPSDVIYFQISIALFNGLLLLYFGINSTTLPLLLVIFATAVALVMIPLLT